MILAIAFASITHIKWEPDFDGDNNKAEAS
jgi:hypothetical protein